MKSRERIERERENRKALYVFLAVAFILLLLVGVMILSFTGGQDTPLYFVNYAMNELKEWWEVAWFKIQNFLHFLK